MPGNVPLIHLRNVHLSEAVLITSAILYIHLFSTDLYGAGCS